MLVNQRLEWRRKFENGEVPTGCGLLAYYRKHRLSESWRGGRATEELCEYIMYLEEELESARKDLMYC